MKRPGEIALNAALRESERSVNVPYDGRTCVRTTQSCS